MSRLCAKPTCAEPAVAWLDVRRTERRVVELTRATESTLALCARHRERFSIPDGWTFETLDGAQADSSGEHSTPKPATRAGRSAQPWFLADAPASEANAQARASHRPLLPGASRAHQGAPALGADAGSLLKRAFHGPNRDRDLERIEHDRVVDRDVASDQGATATEVGVDELEQRRAARAQLDDYGTAQLPFPPLDDEPQIAVS